MAVDSSTSAGSIEVEVAYASPERQHIVSLEVPTGTTATQAVALAHLERLFPDLSAEGLGEAPIGIFGKALRNPQQHVLRSGDRVEVYRPLTIDPKAARQARAQKGRT
ncbi:UPF0125 protein [Halomonas cupida]|uniref:UPF0125 protein HCU01_35380 n=1 Tax=Halomonas cupida TaxID=44933 RepID=A0A1M7KUP5_9GAMM|nr:RnfH family protein [Halomonas cupida]GEN25589.1 UPF0125 protein [Halomonas cupida]SHM69201.1 hypothetical protein SAMN05660971_03619 [Halomonas cupida]